MTAQEFLVWDAHEPLRHEFVRGDVFAMAGASARPMPGLVAHAGRGFDVPATARRSAVCCSGAVQWRRRRLGRHHEVLGASRSSMYSTSWLPTRAAETYTPHSTALPAVQFNKVYLTPCSAAASISVAERQINAVR